MIIGIGMDLAEIDRINDVWNRFGERFADKLLTDGERAQLPATFPVPRLAALFAAKEAAVKALGTGFRQGIGLQCIEILHLPSGKPEITFHGRGLEKCRELGVARAHVTLTHTRDTAGATVILED
ncbi:MAG: holo-[acyl-carrier-protein] synthase [Desulfovibrionaceae bacterium]|nr:holo-[acyl-carrier-protein] synthase [Desulfovibrionaceae bacterium]